MTPLVVFHPRAIELSVAWPMLAAVSALAVSFGNCPKPRIAALLVGLCVMTALSLWLPVLGFSPWWSMVVPLFASGSVVVGGKKPNALWAAAVFWVLAIGLVSGGSGGAGGWGDWFARLLGITAAEAETVVWWLRKAIHFFYYGGMAALLVRVLDFDGPKRAAQGAAVFCLGIAAFDESRQLFTPFRTGSALDFLLDGAGIATFLWLWSLRRRSAQTSG